jgi:acyl-CoA synthetase (AMP-forming)/AMP-acid ligase II
MSYAQLRTDAAAVADASAGWPRRHDAGSPFVAVLADWTPAFAACFLGLASAGWAVGVLDPSWSADEVERAIAQLDPCVVIVEAVCSAALHVLRAAGWRDAAQLDPGWTVCTQSEAEDARPAPAALPENPFYVGFTSGSAGRPKAFVRSHGSWWESFVRFSELCPIDPRGTVLVPGPLSSSHFLFGALHALHTGATLELVTSAEYSPDAVAARLADARRLSGVYVVPTMLAQHATGTSPVSSVDPAFIFCAGARLEATVRDGVAERFPTSCLVEYYGASELSFVAIQVDGDGTPAGTVGRLFPGVEVSIRDDDDHEVAPGEVGTIFARSPLVFSGYRGTAPETAARALEGGWLTVGDRGALDANGFLSVAGRGSSLIITGGANVQPEEVEDVVATHHEIVACVVVGIPDPTWGEVVCAAVATQPGAVVAREDLRRHVAQYLARYKRPRRYLHLAGDVPMGRSGKIDRAAVQRLVLAGELQELR